ncbi:MAG TPA: 3-deoxy-7-phosphoheptulonate synthase class II [Acidobacteriota bacterium]|nr:3-deoxy-7-phosphoheptulonate synthase class II [Acidobacteriota bacterium]
MLLGVSYEEFPQQGDWSPTSWQMKPAAQQPEYADRDHLNRVLCELAKLPPLVTSWEIENLKRQLADAESGGRFILQGGDCSESFEDCESSAIAKKLKILLQMSLVLMQGGGKRVTRIGRFAGQYAKPRSVATETRNGVTLPVYRGDMINRPGFTAAERNPDPDLLLRAYERAALTINFIRSLVDGGFADFQHPEYWDLDFVSKSPLAAEYTKTVDSLVGSLRFLETLTGHTPAEIHRVDFFTSHEGLHLYYEQAQTRQVPRRPGWYNLATHFPWIGDRTRNLDGAHVEYFRGIENPIGVKIGPRVTPEEVLRLCHVLNPRNEPGRLTLIHRFGAEKVEQCLVPIVEAVVRKGLRVVWCCDPMHGNTETTKDGIKTRRFENVLHELTQSCRILKKCGVHLGGVHFELTGDKVTECLGGASGVTEADLNRDYRTRVDPRLNYDQAMEMAFLLARLVKENGG